MKKIIVFFIFLSLVLYSYKYKNNEVKNIVNDKSIIKNDVLKEDKVIDNETSSTVRKVNLLYDNKVINLDLEEYIQGVVSCEMPASFNEEALKAMAVAARTYALYKMKGNKNYDLKSDTSDQCYITTSKMKSKWGNDYEKNYAKVQKAVQETNNQYMTYNDEIIIAFYFSISNGYTENCEDVFVQKLDYLKSVDSSWDKEYNYKEKTKTISIKDFLSKLNINDNKINKIKINKSSTNRISTIQINDKTYKGTKFRSILGLRSTDFEITYDKDNVKINTKGYGHGVGMSQYGAQAMAKKGYTYDQILKHYYTGINIMNKI